MTTKPTKHRTRYAAFLTPEFLARLAADFPASDKDAGPERSRGAISSSESSTPSNLQPQTSNLRCSHTTSHPPARRRSGSVGRPPATSASTPQSDLGPPSGSADLLRHMPKEQLESVRRCHFRDAAGRRCRRDRMHNHPTFCFFHARPEGESDLPPDSPRSAGNGAAPSDSTLEDLLGPLQDYRTAAGVNFTLGRLLLLVADNRISARKAHLIAYICQLLLQSVPAVAKETGAATLDEDEREDLNRAIRATRFLFELPASEEDSPKAPQTTSP